MIFVLWEVRLRARQRGSEAATIWNRIAEYATTSQLHAFDHGYLGF